MKFSVIIPAHNEEGIIFKTVESLENVVIPGYEIVVVNDHSTDKTAEIVDILAKKYGNIRLVENTNEPGFTNALQSGFKNAKTDIFLPVMADLCDDPDTINKMYEKMLEGFDIVCGSRYMRGGRKIGVLSFKSFCSRFVGRSLHLLIGIPTYDISNSFKMYKKNVIESIIIESSGFDISAEIPLKAYFKGFKITEVPTTWVDRKEGKSKFKVFKQGPRYLKLYLWALMNKILVKI